MTDDELQIVVLLITRKEGLDAYNYLTIDVNSSVASLRSASKSRVERSILITDK